MCREKKKNSINTKIEFLKKICWILTKKKSSIIYGESRFNKLEILWGQEKCKYCLWSIIICHESNIQPRFSLRNTKLLKVHYYANQCFHNKTGINQPMMGNFQEILMINISCEFWPISIFITNSYNLYDGGRFYSTTQGLLLII